jgi:hypothetical protein
VIAGASPPLRQPTTRQSNNMMKWYYTIKGGHTHVRVFMNGGKCGDLCFRNEEFEQLMSSSNQITFIPEESSQ